MQTRRVTALFLLLFCFLMGTAAAAIPEKPTTDIYVQDNAKLLRDGTKAHILELGRELDEKTKAQVIVVTVPTLDDRPISEYANELFRTWGIGDKQLNNGVLLLISKEPRKLRIEVGYGLEGALPDGLTGQIRDEQIVPALKKNDYDEGVLQGYEALVAEVQKEYNVTLDTQTGEEFRQARIDAGNAAFWQDCSDFWDEYGTAIKVGFGLLIALIVIFIIWLMKQPSTREPRTGPKEHRRHHRGSGNDDSWFGGGGGGGGGDSFGGGSSGGGGSEGDY